MDFSPGAERDPPFLSLSSIAPLLGGRAVVDAAAELARCHGADAAMAASLRAAQSRARDNAVHFCRWREVERLVGWMQGDGSGATLH